MTDGGSEWLNDSRRKVAMFFFGMALLVSQATPFVPERPTLTYIGGALMGLPLVLHQDRKRAEDE